MELTRRVNLNDRSDRRAMKKLIKREQKAGNIAKGVSARESVKAMLEAQNNYGQYFDENGRIWQPMEVEQVKTEPLQVGIAQVQTPEQISLGKVFQEKPKKKLIKKTVVTEQPVKEYSKSNPHPKYKVIQNPFLPEKVKQILEPEQHEWFQYGIGSNAVPDKTPEEIEQDRIEMNARVKETLNQLLNKIPNFRYISGQKG